MPFKCNYLARWRLTGWLTSKKSSDQCCLDVLSARAQENNLSHVWIRDRLILASLMQWKLPSVKPLISFQYGRASFISDSWKWLHNFLAQSRLQLLDTAGTLGTGGGGNCTFEINQVGSVPSSSSTTTLGEWTLSTDLSSVHQISQLSSSWPQGGHRGHLNFNTSYPTWCSCKTRVAMWQRWKPGKLSRLKLDIGEGEVGVQEPCRANKLNSMQGRVLRFDVWTGESKREEAHTGLGHVCLLIEADIPMFDATCIIIL